MSKIDEFNETVKKEAVMTLATSAKGIVTMRIVSPAYYNGSILIFTDAGSKKYAQLKENPNCCLSVGGFFAQAEAEFFGATMSDENSDMRKAYAEKFKGAFDEGIAFGGRSAEFILLHPRTLSGWSFENGIPTGPFEITL